MPEAAAPRDGASTVDMEDTAAVTDMDSPFIFQRAGHDEHASGAGF